MHLLPDVPSLFTNVFAMVGSSELQYFSYAKCPSLLEDGFPSTYKQGMGRRLPLASPSTHSKRAYRARRTLLGTLRECSNFHIWLSTDIWDPSNCYELWAAEVWATMGRLPCEPSRCKNFIGYSGILYGLAVYSL